jgi:DNA-binding GntR family transcriptional regulator
MSEPAHGDGDVLDIGRLGQRHVLADDVYEVLRTALLDGSIPPNTRVKIDSLAVTLGVSNTPIRQALGRLESDGLVSKEPFRGFVASGVLDQGEVRDVYEVRLLLEPTLADHAASRATRADATAMRELVKAAQTAATGEEQAALVAADRDLHMLIAKVAGNTAACDVLERLLVKSGSFASMYAVPEAVTKTAREHSAIVSAIAKGDVERAESAMRTHLTNALARMADATD